MPDRMEQLSGLPAPVQRYLAFAGVDPLRPIVAMHATQSGTLRTDVRATRWYAFAATHEVALPDRMFSWHARVRLLGPLGLHVHDGLRNGQGYGEVALGKHLRIAQAHGGAMNSAALLRYLAEAIWYPSALLPEAGVTWAPLDAHSAQASLTVGESRVALQFFFAGSGEVTRVYAPARARKDGKHFVDTPWEANLADYRTQQGLTVPWRAQVGWWIDGALQPVWRGSLDAVEWQFSSPMRGDTLGDH